MIFWRDWKFRRFWRLWNIFQKYLQTRKKTICYKKLIQNIQYIQNIQKVSHENLSITFMQCSQLRLPCR